MKKRTLRCAVSLLLLFCMAIALPAGAEAADDTIYVSDLYYGYHTAYMSVPLGNYSIATTQIMADVYEDFINSPSFVWTKVSGSLTAVTSPKQMFQIVSDAFIETEFTYNSALTAANEKLALGLLQMTSNQTDLTSTASAIVDRVNAMGDLLSVIYQDCDLESLTDIEAIDRLFDYMINNDTMKSLTSAQLEQVRTIILDDLQYIGNLTTAVTSIIDLMGGLYMSLVVEDARLLMLDTILPLADEGTTLHDGLSLLDSQLRGGFATYFFDNYVVNEGLDIATTLGKNYLAGACPPAALAVGLIDLANTVLFDVIFDVPSVDDFMLQTVLTHYAIDLHTITRDKLDVFEQPFSSADVVAFEQLYAAFSAAVTAGLEATERLTLDENRADFEAVQERYGNYNYEAYVNEIIEELYTIEPERRVMKYFTWKPTGELRVEQASNSLKEGYIYEFQGAIHGDLVVSDGLTIGEDEVCVIEGDLDHTKGRLTNKGTLHVKGDMEVSSGWGFSDYIAVLNTGTMQVDGDLSMTYTGNGSSYSSYFNNHGTVDVNGDISLVGPKCFFSMEDANAVLTVSGDLSAYAFTSWYNSHQGAIILDGSTQQQVTNLAVHDLTVENEEGIKYLSDVKLHGAFDPQDAPIDCNTHLLQVCSSSASFVGDGYNYGRIRVVTSWTFSGNAVFDTLDTVAGTTITEGSCCTVKGKLYHSKDRLTVNGDLHVKGDLEVSSGWGFSDYETVLNTGTMQVDGDLSMTYTGNGSSYSSYFNNHGIVDVNGDISLVGPRCFFSMEDANAVLTVSGDLSAYAFTSWDNSHQGTIILDGSTRQQVTNLAVHDLTIENEEGVKYLSDVKLHGAFDPQDAPIDCNTHFLQICSSSASFVGDGYDYGDVSIEQYFTLSKTATFRTLTQKARFDIDKDAVCTVLQDMTQSYGILVIDGTLRVKGDMEVSSGWNFTSYEVVINNGTLTVDGDLSMTYSSSGKYYNATLTNCGTVDVRGDLSLVGSKTNYKPNSEEAVLKVGGDVYACDHDRWTNMTVGQLILDGDRQQTITNLKVSDLTVENPEGIRYGSDLQLLGGLFDPNGHPMEQNGHTLRIMGNNITLAAGQNYGDVSIEQYFTLSKTATFRTLTQKARFDIDKDAVCTVTSDMTQSYGILVIDGTLRVKGDMEVSNGWNYSSYEVIRNNGTLSVDGDLSMTYPQSGKNYNATISNYGTTNIGGDLALVGPKCVFSQNDASLLIVGGDCTGNTGNLRMSAGTVQSLAAEETSALIATSVPLSTVAAERARASYDTLSAWQKQFVTNYSVLTAAEEELAQSEKFSLVGANMTLGSTLHLNFIVQLADLPDADGCTAVVTKMAGEEIAETVTIPANDWKANKKYRMIPFPLAAKEMCSTVYVEVFDKDGRVLSENYSDSIRGYAMRALNSGTLTPQAATMMVDMLLYGAEAQVQFKHETSQLADSLLTEELLALASEDVVCENKQLKGSNFYGSNLSLESSIQLNVFFSGMKRRDVQAMYAEVRSTDQYGKDIHITVPGSSFLPHGTSRDIYKIVIDALNVGDARQMVTVLVYDEDGELFGSCQDSIESYVKRAETATASPLYAAIMRFAVSTNLYLTTR